MRLTLSKICWIVICLSPFFGAAQKSFSLENQVKTGFILVHRPYLQHLVDKNWWGNEIYITQEKNFGYNGISLEWRNFGNKEILGNAFSISFFNAFNLFQSKSGFGVQTRYLTGLGFLTKKYDEVTNSKNIAIGSHVNVRASAQFNLFQTWNRNKFNLGIEFNHFSNGAITAPNLGINSIGLIFGYSRFFGEIRLEKTKINWPNKTEFFVEGISTLKQVPPIPLEPTRHIVLGLKTGMLHYFNNWGINVGVELIYNPANNATYPFTNYNFWDILQIGAFGGMSYRFGNSCILFNYGIYLRDKIKAGTFLYNRIGYRYYLKNGFYTHFAIKAHFAQADYFETGIGWSLKH